MKMWWFPRQNLWLTANFSRSQSSLITRMLFEEIYLIDAHLSFPSLCNVWIKKVLELDWVISAINLKKMIHPIERFIEMTIRGVCLLWSPIEKLVYFDYVLRLKMFNFVLSTIWPSVDSVHLLYVAAKSKGELCWSIQKLIPSVPCPSNPHLKWRSGPGALHAQPLARSGLELFGAETSRPPHCFPT